jgi:predicted peroxiredoxin
MPRPKQVLCLLLVVSVAAAIYLAAGRTVPAKDTQSIRDGVFIHVSHGADDPHRVLMALSMAEIMSMDRDVLVYFDIRGVDVVLNDAPDLAYEHFSSSRDQLASLSQKGVTLMACPGCLRAAGKTASDLAPGIEVADKDRFFSFTQGRILSLDY